VISIVSIAAPLTKKMVAENHSQAKYIYVTKPCKCKEQNAA